MKCISLASVAIALLVSGCAGRQEVVTLAGQSSAVLNQYKQELASFARHQNAVAQDNERRLADLTQLKERVQGRVDKRLFAWRLVDDKPALETYSRATEKGADQILASSQALRAESPLSREVSSVRFDSAQVEALVKSLSALQKSRTFWDHVAFGVAYGQDLQGAYKKSLEDSVQEGTKAVSAAEAAQSQVNAPE